MYVNVELQMACCECGNKLLLRLRIPFVCVQSMAVCAASPIWDKVSVGITNNPIHFHRLALKERWNRKTREWKISGQQNKGTEGRLSLVSRWLWRRHAAKHCVCGKLDKVVSSSVSYLLCVTLHIEATGHPIFRMSFIHFALERKGFFFLLWFCNLLSLSN